MMVIDRDIARAADILRQGGTVAFPTETVYGLGADASSDRAVAKIFAAKQRPQFNPLIVHVPDLAAAETLGRFDETARKLAVAFWPGPLTIVVPRREGCPISMLASAGLPSIAIRVPRHPTAQALLRESGLPLAAPSANRSGRISPTAPEHVAKSLGEAVDMILTGGICEVGLESTIVSCLGDGPGLLRPGGVPREAIEAILGQPLAQAAPDPERPQAPGQLVSHYAPRARLRLDAVKPAASEAWLSFGEHEVAASPITRNLSPSGDLVEAAANLFRYLHELDASGVEVIAVAPVPRNGLGEAINDRLRRAAAPRQAAQSEG
ncbi:L-threonylcarbamoyladenylate synthase [Rhodoligotrophos defluvii]|uniref:L-threonylcarbamoyladenylate synthase n=1 Tax=Rhodoligotrophos defluvii TaxID=2561934 RepID=UPI0010C93CAF|nr:L-threonylcarbamoyladenylate synthase [Rhodoligotrophos defluvii]